MRRAERYVESRAALTVPLNCLRLEPTEDGAREEKRVEEVEHQGMLDQRIATRGSRENKVDALGLEALEAIAAHGPKHLVHLVAQRFEERQRQQILDDHKAVFVETLQGSVDATSVRLPTTCATSSRSPSSSTSSSSRSSFSALSQSVGTLSGTELQMLRRLGREPERAFEVTISHGLLLPDIPPKQLAQQLRDPSNPTQTRRPQLTLFAFIPTNASVRGLHLRRSAC